MAGGIRYRDIKPYDMPDSLDELQGPSMGTVTLPPHVYWAPGENTFSLDSPAGATLVYTALLSEGTAQEQRHHLNKEVLMRLWPSMMLPVRLVKQWQARFPELSGNKRADWQC